MTALQKILSTVESLGGAIATGDPLAIIKALGGLMLDVGQDPAVLTPERELAIEREVHHKLRQAHLIEEADLP